MSEYESCTSWAILNESEIHKWCQKYYFEKFCTWYCIINLIVKKQNFKLNWTFWRNHILLWKVSSLLLPKANYLYRHIESYSTWVHWFFLRKHWRGFLRIKQDINQYRVYHYGDTYIHCYWFYPTASSLILLILYYLNTFCGMNWHSFQYS